MFIRLATGLFCLLRTIQLAEMIQVIWIGGAWNRRSLVSEATALPFRHNRCILQYHLLLYFDVENRLNT